MISIIVDSRETHIIPHLDLACTSAPDIPYEARQITTGDYLIMQGPAGGEQRVVACIERKTLHDFAASFRDRYAGQRAKMLEMRTITGCQLFYLIEGQAFPPLDRKISRTPYRSILTAITSLMVRDKMFVVQTRNERHTADRIYDIARSFAKYACEADPVSAGNDQGGSAEMTPVPESYVGGIPDPEKKSLDSLAVEMWSSLSGISMVTARSIVDQMSAVEFFAKGPADIDCLKAGGRAFNKKAKQALKHLLGGVPDAEARFLGGVPGLSNVTAKRVVQTVRARDVVRMPPEELAEMQVPRGASTCRWGKPRADRAVELFSYVRRAPQAGSSLCPS